MTETHVSTYVTLVHTVYVDIGANSGDTAVLNFAFNVGDDDDDDDDNNVDRRWDVKVTQIECTNPNSSVHSTIDTRTQKSRHPVSVFFFFSLSLMGQQNSPPETCLQYMTGLTGRIETFNFRSTTDNHLNNQE